MGVHVVSRRRLCPGEMWPYEELDSVIGGPEVGSVGHPRVGKCVWCELFVYGRHSPKRMRMYVEMNRRCILCSCAYLMLPRHERLPTR